MATRGSDRGAPPPRARPRRERKQRGFGGAIQHASLCLRPGDGEGRTARAITPLWAAAGPEPSSRTGLPRVRLDRPRRMDLCDLWKAESTHVGVLLSGALDGAAAP